METESIRIHLTPADDDAALDSPEYQAELDAFDKALRSHGIVPQRVLERLEGAAGPGEPATWLGQFVIVAKAVGPGILAAVAGYFHGKRGRGVTFEIGKDGRFKGSAPSLKGAQRLLPQLLAASRKNMAEKPQTKKARKEKPERTPPKKKARKIEKPSGTAKRRP